VRNVPDHGCVFTVDLPRLGVIAVSGSSPMPFVLERLHRAGDLVAMELNDADDA
jgi:hypothetical protein